MTSRSAYVAARKLLACALLQAAVSSALSVDLNDPASIKTAASTIAYDMMTYYVGNQSGQIPGLLPPASPPYYWWEGGAMWGALIDYWYYTGDSTYNEVVTQGLLFQASPDANFEPQNQTFDLGNDDQAFWALATLSAAELKFPNPPAGQPQWLPLAQAVFNRQAERWDTTTCNGGLRWQIFQFNGGYDYKNAISNGCFFNIAARLYKYTGNETYALWANKAYDWSLGVGLIDEKYNVFDGVYVTDNCTAVDHLQWSYNVGVYLLGAATMWNMTQNNPTIKALWETRTQGLLTATNTFFTNNSADTMYNVMWEIECEPHLNCNQDQKSFKAYLSRWMAATTKVAPWTYEAVFDKLTPSAEAAAASCNGGDSGTFCGLKWTPETWDGTLGVGQQMDALEVVQAHLITAVSAPVTGETGGTSQSDPNAGTGSGSSAQDGSSSSSILEVQSPTIVSSSTSRPPATTTPASPAIYSSPSTLSFSSLSTTTLPATSTITHQPIPQPPRPPAPSSSTDFQPQTSTARSSSAAVEAPPTSTAPATTTSFSSAVSPFPTSFHDLPTSTSTTIVAPSSTTSTTTTRPISASTAILLTSGTTSISIPPPAALTSIQSGIITPLGTSTHTSTHSSAKITVIATEAHITSATSVNVAAVSTTPPASTTTSTVSGQGGAVEDNKGGAGALNVPFGTVGAGMLILGLLVL